MKELQSVMFDVGLGTPVTREESGKEYYSQLAKQFAQFMHVYAFTNIYLIGSFTEKRRNNDIY